MKPRRALPGNAGHHAVQFYADADRLASSVADFLGDGLAAGQPTLLLATADHGQRILRELATRRFDVDTLTAEGDLLLLDADVVLGDIIVEDRVDASRFRQLVGSTIRRLSTRDEESVVRAYGELVDVLWAQGRHHLSIELESLWNDLARQHAFSLLCAYDAQHVGEDTAHGLVCAQHTHVYAD